jgi:hypothetical protein
MPEGGTSRPFGRGGVEIAAGTGLYTACAEVLGIPYWPSILRANLLSRVARRQLELWRFRAGGEVLDMLARDRDKLVSESVGALVEFGEVELNMPAVLTMVLQQARRAEDHSLCLPTKGFEGGG